MKNFNQQVNGSPHQSQAESQEPLNSAQSQASDRYSQEALNAKVNDQFARTKRYLEIIQMGGHLGC